ncbi:hypothetical protein KAZ01_03300, partial [Candidatus Gracilibacteria bacterium]|nr:hypothetical protein [Candidatus Gracilibacteria bacterium]
KVFLVNLENPIKTFRTFDTLQCWVESVMISESEFFLAKRHFFKISYEFHRRKEQTILFGQTTKLINLGDILVDDSNNNEEYKVKGIGSLTNKNDGLYCSIIIDTSNNNEKNFVGRELIIKI